MLFIMLINIQSLNSVYTFKLNLITLLCRLSGIYTYKIFFCNQRLVNIKKYVIFNTRSVHYILNIKLYSH